MIIILYFLISVPALFLRLTVKDPSLMADFKLISKTNFCSGFLAGSSPLSISFMVRSFDLMTIELLGVVSRTEKISDDDNLG